MSLGPVFFLREAFHLQATLEIDIFPAVVMRRTLARRKTVGSLYQSISSAATSVNEIQLFIYLDLPSSSALKEC